MMINRKLGELTIDKSADYHDRVVKALEDAGFILVLDYEFTMEKHYIVAEREKSNADSN